MTIENLELARYISAYIQEELSRGLLPDEITADVIGDAIDAFEGGAR